MASSGARRMSGIKPPSVSTAEVLDLPDVDATKDDSAEAHEDKEWAGLVNEDKRPSHIARLAVRKKTRNSLKSLYSNNKQRVQHLKKFQLRNDIRCMGVVADDQVWVSSRDGSIHIRDSHLGTKVSIIRAHRPDSRIRTKFYVNVIYTDLLRGRVWVGASDSIIRVYDVAKRKMVAELTDHNGGIKCIVGNDDAVWTASEDFTIYQRSVIDGAVLKQMVGHASWVHCMTTDPVYGHLWSGSVDGIRIWNVDPPEVGSGDTKLTKADLRRRQSGLRAPAVRAATRRTSGGSSSVAGSSATIQEDGFVDSNCLALLKGHDGPVLTLLAADETYVWSGSADKHICMWDVTDRTLVHKFQAHSHWVHCMKVVEHDIWTASFTELRVWDSKTGDMIQEVKLDGKGKVADLVAINGRVWIGCRQPGSLHIYRVFTRAGSKDRMRVLKHTGSNKVTSPQNLDRSDSADSLSNVNPTTPPDSPISAIPKSQSVDFSALSRPRPSSSHSNSNGNGSVKKPPMKRMQSEVGTRGGRTRKPTSRLTRPNPVNGLRRHSMIPRVGGATPTPPRKRGSVPRAGSAGVVRRSRIPMSSSPKPPSPSNSVKSSGRVSGGFFVHDDEDASTVSSNTSPANSTHSTPKSGIAGRKSRHTGLGKASRVSASASKLVRPRSHVTEPRRAATSSALGRGRRSNGAVTSSGYGIDRQRTRSRPRPGAAAARGLAERRAAAQRKKQERQRQQRRERQRPGSRGSSRSDKDDDSNSGDHAQRGARRTPQRAGQQAKQALHSRKSISRVSDVVSKSLADEVDALDFGFDESSPQKKKAHADDSEDADKDKDNNDEDKDNADDNETPATKGSAADEDDNASDDKTRKDDKSTKSGLQMPSKDPNKGFLTPTERSPNASSRGSSRKSSMGGDSDTGGAGDVDVPTRLYVSSMSRSQLERKTKEIHKACLKLKKILEREQTEKLVLAAKLDTKLEQISDLENDNAELKQKEFVNTDKFSKEVEKLHSVTHQLEEKTQRVNKLEKSTKEQAKALQRMAQENAKLKHDIEELQADKGTKSDDSASSSELLKLKQQVAEHEHVMQELLRQHESAEDRCTQLEKLKATLESKIQALELDNESLKGQLDEMALHHAVEDVAYLDDDDDDDGAGDDVTF